MRTPLRFTLVGSAAAVLLAGCGGYEPGEDAVDVRVRQVLDLSEGMYFEGSYSYVRVERPQGGKLLEDRLPDGDPVGRERYASDVVLRPIPANTASSASSAPAMAVATRSTLRPTTASA